jgi:pyruvate formate lyase activating enzyme
VKTKKINEQPNSPVYAFLEKPSMIDFPGHMCGVFFTSGCNFTCGFCHNAVLMGKKQKTLSWDRLEHICRVFKNEWVDAVCITGGEPTLEPELIKLIHFFRDRGFKIKLDSNGSRPEILKDCLPLVDLIAMDIKCGADSYGEFVGFPNIGNIKESIELIKNSGVDYEFRTTVITPFHTDEEMLAAGELIKGAKRYCLQAFVPQDSLPSEEFRNTLRTTPGRLKELQKLMAPFADTVTLRGA